MYALTVEMVRIAFVLIWIVNFVQSESSFEPRLLNASSTVYYSSGEKLATKGQPLRMALSHIYHAHSPHIPENCDDICVRTLRSRNIDAALTRKRFNRSVNVVNVRPEGRSGKSPVSVFWLNGHKSSEHYVTVAITNTQESNPQLVDLNIDTGSSLTWWQCRPCVRCFPQRRRVFNPDPPQHHTFFKLKLGDPFCDLVQQSDLGDGASATECDYHAEFADGSESKGIMALDHIRCKSLDEQTYFILANIGFGCARDSNVNVAMGSAGALGLAAGYGISIPEQLRGQIGMSFGYCFPIVGSDFGAGFLYLGDEAIPGGAQGFDFTPLLMTTGFPGWYYLDVVDFHVNGISVGIPPGVFDIGPDRHGGMFVDTGSMITELVPGAYYHLRDAYINAMADALGTFVFTGVHDLDTCWDVSGKDVNNIEAAKYGPIFRAGNMMTFGRTASFLNYRSRFGHDLWCLPVSIPDPGDRESVLGEYSQMQTHMGFDMLANALVWKNTQC